MWSVGRQFEKGRTKWRNNGLALPEAGIPLLMGIWGSAFCATLSHYYKEIRPILKGLSGFGGIDQMISDRDEDLVKLHPIDPASIPNFALGMQGMLPETCPDSLYSTDYLQLMDAGMSNNLPIYPLLRKGRGVDVVIAFDASADVRADNWLKVVDGYARQRNITSWPLGAGWPTIDTSVPDAVDQLESMQSKVADAVQQTDAGVGPDIPSSQQLTDSKVPESLGYCNIWVGSAMERRSTDEPPPSKLVGDDFHMLTEKDAGMTVIYFPFLPNPKAGDIDPTTSDYLSTWNFTYSSSQIEDVVNLARINFSEGKEQTKRAIRAVYERKRKLRLHKEAIEKNTRRSRKMRLGIPRGRKIGEADHGDHFS